MSIACVASNVHAAAASISKVGMLSAPVSDSWEGPERRGATGEAIFGNSFFRTHVRTPPFSTLEEGGSENFFFGNRRDTAPRWSAWSLEAQAC